MQKNNLLSVWLFVGSFFTTSWLFCQSYRNPIIMDGDDNPATGCRVNGTNAEFLREFSLHDGLHRNFSAIIVGDNHNIAACSIQTDLPYPDTLILIPVHLSCCSLDKERIAETQAIMYYLEKNYSVWRKEDTMLRLPVVITGDFNMVGSEIPYYNIITIQLTQAQKPWFTDLAPHQIDRPLAFTWSDYSKAFSPNRLDFIFYSPLLNAVYSFVFHLLYLNENWLEKYGLNPLDLHFCSDHLQLVSDFALAASPN